MPRNFDYLPYILQFKNFVRCEKCRKDCKVDPIFCNVCCKWFHRKCGNGKALMTKVFYNSHYLDKNNFICSNKCYNSILPFSTMDNIGVVTTSLGDGKLSCKKCKRDCVQSHIECVKCMNCDAWFHQMCTNVTGLDTNFFLCSPRCSMKIMSFSNFTTHELVEHSILPNYTPYSKQENDLVVSENENNSPDASWNNRNFVSIDHFLNINCSYLNPNSLNDDILRSNISDLSIFHNNVRSLNANFLLIHEIFQKCSKLPDIFAFTETKLNDDKDPPPMAGYSFESKNSPSSCGGVGLYLSNLLDYTLRPDLSLQSESCEDLWVQLNIKNSSSQSQNKKFVVGVIYRHPKQKFKDFCEKLC